MFLNEPTQIMSAYQFLFFLILFIEITYFSMIKIFDDIEQSDLKPIKFGSIIIGLLITLILGSIYESGMSLIEVLSNIVLFSLLIGSIILFYKLNIYLGRLLLNYKKKKYKRII